MSVQVLISILVLFAVISFVGFIWQVYVMRAVGTKGRRRKLTGKQRDTDTRQLSPTNKKIYLQSQELLSSGRAPQAAQLLESIQMQREAITILENAGLIHEAARVLMRMGKHNRAGVIYARHGYWERAADSFKMAEMPLEVAKCAKESGNFLMASEYFLLANRSGDAGKMLIETGDHRNAARHLADGLEIDLAMEQYQAFLLNNKSDASAFDKDELKIMAGWLMDGNYNRDISRIVASTNRAKELVLAYAKQGKSEEGAEAFRLSKKDFSSDLLGEVNYENPVMWEELAKIFILNGLFEKAGIIFEKKSLFERAAVAFEKGENRARAMFCYERAGMLDKANNLRENVPLFPSNTSAANPKQKSQESLSTSSAASLRGSKNSQKFGDMKNADNREPKTRILSIPVPQQTDSELKQKDSSRSSRFSDDDDPESTNYQSEDESDSEDSDDQDMEDSEDLKPIELVRAPPISKNFADIQIAKPAPIKSPANASQKTPAAPKLIPTPAPVPAPKKDWQDTENFSSLTLDQAAAAPEDSAEYITFSLEDSQIDRPISTLSKSDSDQSVPHPAFAQAAFIAELSDREMSKLWRIGSTRNFTKGEVIINYSDEPEGVYFILTGRVSCFRVVGGVDQPLEAMQPAETFGELWLLSGHPTAVKFVSQEKCSLRLLLREDFNNLMDQEGAIARKVYRRYTARLLTHLLKPQQTKGNSKAG